MAYLEISKGGYISGVYFQRCSKFIAYIVPIIFFTSKGDRVGARPLIRPWCSKGEVLDTEQMSKMTCYCAMGANTVHGQGIPQDSSFCHFLSHSGNGTGNGKKTSLEAWPEDKKRKCRSDILTYWGKLFPDASSGNRNLIDMSKVEKKLDQVQRLPRWAKK